MKNLCFGAGFKIAPYARGAGEKRAVVCTSCARTVRINYNGTVRAHRRKHSWE